MPNTTYSTFNLQNPKRSPQTIVKRLTFVQFIRALVRMLGTDANGQVDLEKGAQILIGRILFTDQSSISLACAPHGRNTVNFLTLFSFLPTRVSHIFSPG